MSYIDDRRRVLEMVRENGSNLEIIDEIFRDDLEIVATAILSRVNGGNNALKFASERLRGNSELRMLIPIARDFQNTLNEIQHSKTPRKNKLLDDIEYKKQTIVNQFFTEYNIESIVIPKQLKQYIDQGVLGTIQNRPFDRILRNLANESYQFIDAFLRLDNDSTLDYELFDCISRKSVLLGCDLRRKLCDFYKTHSNYPVIGLYGKNHKIVRTKLPDSVLFAIDLLQLSLKEVACQGAINRDILEFLKAFDNYVAVREANINPDIIDKARKQALKVLKKLSSDDFLQLFHSYFSSLNVKNVFANKRIVIHQVTNTARNVISNVKGLALQDSFHGVLLEGKIDVASDKGYTEPLSKQQDAVGSYAYDERHFISIVADGVGSAEDGHNASRYLVDRLLSWYQMIPNDMLEDINSLEALLNQEIMSINKELYVQYCGSALTTLVLSLIAGDHTIIANIGDSTAYTYRSNTDRLVNFTTLDIEPSLKGLSYEEFRRNPNNYIITAAVGSSDYPSLHSTVIKNVGQRLILSSDGDTDLISEENFKTLFNKKSSSQEIVWKARDFPDYYSGMIKKMDNISAVVVELPSSQKNYHGRRF